jgi:PST family polysaccharide transporter
MTGILGWLLAVILAKPLSEWMLGSAEHAWAIAALGITLLISAISNGQLALLQGLRRIGDMARANVLGVLVSTGVSIALYAWLGQDGIVPVLVTSALISLGFSYWFSRRVAVLPVPVSWRETVAGTRRLAGLGVAFMWSGVLTAGLDMLTRAVITRQFGLEAAGIYQAAWALSGLFAGFILGAMGADFYPRLTAVIHDKEQAVRTVNEQTEIGILLALPGLLATLAFAPWAMEIFYSKRFLAGAELLPWMVLGVFGRVISWPMGFILLAKGASRWFIATETIFIGIQAALVFWMVPAFGAVGAAYAFAVSYALYAVGMLWVGRVLIGFRWSPFVLKMLLTSCSFTGLGLATSLFLAGGFGMLVGTVIVFASIVMSLRGLTKRVGPDSKWVKWVSGIPGGRRVIGLR